MPANKFLSNLRKSRQTIKVLSSARLISWLHLWTWVWNLSRSTARELSKSSLTTQPTAFQLLRSLTSCSRTTSRKILWTSSLLTLTTTSQEPSTTRSYSKYSSSSWESKMKSASMKSTTTCLWDTTRWTEKRDSPPRRLFEILAFLT